MRGSSYIGDMLCMTARRGDGRSEAWVGREGVRAEGLTLYCRLYEVLNVVFLFYILFFSFFPPYFSFFFIPEYAQVTLGVLVVQDGNKRLYN